jgi:hypothetical protein
LYMHQFGGALAGHDFKKAPTFELILPISSDYFLRVLGSKQRSEWV